jgi:aspartyl-tRNA(Asn)/glutamyl-tRNA(Gln) amidotransferase subunit C
MTVTVKDVERIAALAHLSFTDSEKQRLAIELNEILSYMEILNAVDTSGVEPLSGVVPLTNVFREDASRPSAPREDMLRIAPDRTAELFRGPSAVGSR